MSLNELFDKLMNKHISPTEYNSLKTQCMNYVKKAAHRYKLDTLLYKPVDLEDACEEIYTISIIKSLRNYNKAKGSFSTYFYYKTSSTARVVTGKVKRRYAILNTHEIDKTNRGEK